MSEQAVTTLTLPDAATSGPHRDRTRRRWIAGGFAVALHLAILALFLRSHPPVDRGSGEGRGAFDVSLAGFSRGTAPSKTTPQPPTAAPSAPAAPAPPAPPDPIKPRSVLAIVSDILAIPLPEHSVTPTPLVPTPSSVLARAIAQASGAPGAACDIAGAVETALSADPATHGSVLLIPMKPRAAANAVMLWNGQWIAPGEVGGAAAFDTLRIAIRQIVAAAQQECRDAEIVGPRFMVIPDGDATMVVVFGDASWRWSDLLVDADQPSPIRFGTN